MPRSTQLGVQKCAGIYIGYLKYQYVLDECLYITLTCCNCSLFMFCCFQNSAAEFCIVLLIVCFELQYNRNSLLCYGISRANLTTVSILILVV